MVLGIERGERTQGHKEDKQDRDYKDYKDYYYFTKCHFKGSQITSHKILLMLFQAIHTFPWTRIENPPESI